VGRGVFALMNKFIARKPVFVRLYAPQLPQSPKSIIPFALFVVFVCLSCCVADVIGLPQTMAWMFL
jgi:hypothetical protein